KLFTRAATVKRGADGGGWGFVMLGYRICSRHPGTPFPVSARVSHNRQLRCPSFPGGGSEATADPGTQPREPRRIPPATDRAGLGRPYTHLHLPPVARAGGRCVALSAAGFPGLQRACARFRPGMTDA